MNESILLLQIDFASNNQEEYNKILVFSKAIEVSNSTKFII